MIEIHRQFCTLCKAECGPHCNTGDHKMETQIEQIDDFPIKTFIKAADDRETPGTVIVELAQGLNEKQLYYAIVELAMMFREKQRMVDWLATEQGVVSSQSMIDIARLYKVGGAPIWQHLLNGKP